MWLWLLITVIALSLALLAAQRRRSSANLDTDGDDRPAGRISAARSAAAAANSEPAATAEKPATNSEGDADAASADEGEPEAPPARPLAPFNHRRHWAILEGVEDAHAFLLQILKELLREDSKAGAFVRGELCHMVDNRGHLMFSALMRRGERLELLAMFPYSESPHVWPLQVKRIEESPDGLEARLVGSCGGLPVGLYDTLYLKKSRRLSPRQHLRAAGQRHRLPA